MFPMRCDSGSDPLITSEGCKKIQKIETGFNFPLSSSPFFCNLGEMTHKKETFWGPRRLFVLPSHYLFLQVIQEIHASYFPLPEQNVVDQYKYMVM